MGQTVQTMLAQRRKLIGRLLVELKGDLGTRQ